MLHVQRCGMNWSLEALRRGGGGFQVEGEVRERKKGVRGEGCSVQSEKSASIDQATFLKHGVEKVAYSFTCLDSIGVVCSIDSVASSMAKLVALPLELTRQAATWWPSLPSTKHSLFSRQHCHSSGFSLLLVSRV